jgi:hypothetical protein
VPEIRERSTNMADGKPFRPLVVGAFSNGELSDWPITYTPDLAAIGGSLLDDGELVGIYKR